MPAALHITARVLPGKRIEVTAPELPDEGTVELVIYLPDSAEEAMPFTRYPEPLNAEYNALTQAQRHRRLTSDETTRLEAIQAEINALDVASAAGAAW